MIDPEKPLPSLEELQRRIDIIKPESEEAAQARSVGPNIGKAMRLGTDLLAGVGVGGVAGYFLDRWLGTSPLFLITFFFLGFAAGVRNILRSANKVDL